MARSSSRKTANNNNNEVATEAEAQEVVPVLPAAVRQRNRAVAEREASRLARPERGMITTLGHASRSKSAVTSTPSGMPKSMGAPVSSSLTHPDHHEEDSNDTSRSVQRNLQETKQEWCGPFSVARQVSL